MVFFWSDFYETWSSRKIGDTAQGSVNDGLATGGASIGRSVTNGATPASFIVLHLSIIFFPQDEEAGGRGDIEAAVQEGGGGGHPGQLQAGGAGRGVLSLACLAVELYFTTVGNELSVIMYYER